MRACLADDFIKAGIVTLVAACIYRLWPKIGFISDKPSVDASPLAIKNCAMRWVIFRSNCDDLASENIARCHVNKIYQLNKSVKHTALRLNNEPCKA
jgi:hypothetical protein